MPSWSLEFITWGIVDKSSIINIKHMSGSWALSINLKKGFLIVAGDLHEKVNQTELWIGVAKSQIECSHRRYTNELVGWHTTYDYSLHFHTIYTIFLHDLQHFFIKCVRWCLWILPLHTSDEVLGILCDTVRILCGYVLSHSWHFMNEFRATCSPVIAIWSAPNVISLSQPNRLTKTWN